MVTHLGATERHLPCAMCVCVSGSVFGLVCQTDAVSDAFTDNVIVNSLLAAATGIPRPRTTDLTLQHFSDVCMPTFSAFNRRIYARSSYCFQRVLAIAILSVCLSVRHTGGSVKNGAS